MNINLIIPSFYPAVVYGGPIFSSLYACRELAALGHRVTVATTNANRPHKLEVPPNTPSDFEPNISVTYYDDTIRERLSFPLMTNLSREMKQADVVHVQYIFSTPTPIGLAYAKMMNKPAVISPRGALAPWILKNGLPLKGLWIRALLGPFANHIYWHATSLQEKREIQAIFPKARVFIIPNGISLEEYTSQEAPSRMELIHTYVDQPEVEADALVVSMGRLQAKKGFDILITAFQQFLSTYPNAYLLIAGQDDGEEGRLRQQIKHANLERRIHLVGQVNGNAKRKFFAAADVFALPSHNENFGNVYPEALASGTPIVASTSTPWEEAAIAGCGKWVENTPEKTAQAMIELCQGDREDLRKSALKFVSAYDWKAIGQQFSQVYQQIMEGKWKQHL
ncbi:MAG: glycosyltransferase [Bacteroidota bacterium]